MNHGKNPGIGKFEEIAVVREKFKDYELRAQD